MWSLPVVMLATLTAQYGWLLLALLLWLDLCRRRGVALAFMVLLLSPLLAWQAQAALDRALTARLPPALEGAVLTFAGRVADLPEQAALGQGALQRVRFLLDADPGALPWPGRHRLQLSWFAEDVSALQAGARVRVTVRLRAPRGLVNERGFDSERQALARGVVARGTVQSLQVLAPGHGLHHWREQLSARLAGDLAGHDRAARLLPALVSGDRRAIDGPLWQLLQRTGTAHLVAISGLHISLVAGLVWWLASRLLALPLAWGVGQRPAQWLAVGPALLAACGYAALAGFSLPTQRALVMTAVALLCLVARWRLGPGQVLWLAAMVVTVPAPLAWLDTSFWLSFGAVALLVLLHGAGRAGVLRMQLALTLVFGVLAGGLFGLWSLAALPANLLLVPLFSLLLVPLALLQALPGGAVLAPLTAALLNLALDWLALLGDWPLLPLPATLMAALATALVLLRLLLPALPGPRWPWLLALPPLLWPPAPTLQHGEVELHVFDVGQGQMMVLGTRHHRVIYDAGPAWLEGDAVSRLLLPWWGRAAPPALVFASHHHSDHAGGLASLPDGWQGVDRFSGEPERWPGSLPCLRGQGWWLDGVAFEVLWPPPMLPLRHSNNRSCVLRVRARNQTLLLTGDIGREVEYWLAQHDDLRAEVLQVPHHGSHSSSSFTLLRAVSPRYAFVSAGHGNAFGHPADRIVARYVDAGVVLHSTAASGMLVYRGNGTPPRRERLHSAFPWRLPEPVVE